MERSGDWVKIFESGNVSHANIIRMMLIEHDIPCVLLDKKDSIYGTFGQAELYTQSEFVMRAIQLIKKHNE